MFSTHTRKSYDNKSLWVTANIKIENSRIQYLAEAVDDWLRDITTITSQNNTLHIIFVDERSISWINIENDFSGTRKKTKEKKLF